nr:MAG TPA: hypothetical protein [Bacteriophage sp.]
MFASILLRQTNSRLRQRCELRGSGSEVKS